MSQKAPTPLIEISGLRQKLGQHWVLDGVDLTIDKGEIIGIIGGSGSGKTTLLRDILMLLHPTEGEIKVFDTDILGCSEDEALAIQHRWGVLFQRNALFSSLTVVENVQFPLRVFTQLPLDFQRKLALMKIALVGLPLSAADKYPAELSGGMQKRAALARALALDPELLFLDEPTAGLDPQSSNAFDKLILELHEGLGLTVVMVTHDVVSLEHITQRVAFLGKGTVLATLPLAELRQQSDPSIQEYFATFSESR